ncbi:helix-turn-helix domain-containing protein [Bradyrhizobium sp. USDA 4502]
MTHTTAEAFESGAEKPGYARGLFLWLRQVAVDRSLPPMALHVATIVAQHVNQRSGDAWPTQETIANALGITDRAVRRNVTELAARGHLDVAVSGGRHRPNVYRPILKTRTPASGNGCENPDASVRLSDQKPGRTRQENPDARGRNPDARVQKPGRQRPTELPNELPIELPKGTTQRAHARESDRLRHVDHGDRSARKPRQRPANGHQHGEGFEEFYAAYPRHVARGAAEKAYARIIRAGEATPDELLVAARRYADERNGQEPKFTKHPATWLSKQCWLDEPAARPETPAERIKRQSGLLGNFDEGDGQ